jgi:hypothetical protein
VATAPVEEILLSSTRLYLTDPGKDIAKAKDDRLGCKG